MSFRDFSLFSGVQTASFRGGKSSPKMNLDEKLWTSTSLCQPPPPLSLSTPGKVQPHLVLRAAIHTNAATPCLIFSCFETIALPLGVRVLLPHVVSMNRSWHHRILLQNDGCVCVFFSENRLKKKKKLYIEKSLLEILYKVSLRA